MSIQFYLTIILITVVLTIITTIIISREILKNEFDQIKLDITLDAMKESEEKIKKALMEHNLSVCSDIEMIAKALCIKKGGEDPSITKSQAHLSRADNNGIRTVTFRPGLGHTEKRFAFAHECAHIVNKDETPIDRPVGKNKPMCEQLADYVGAAMLMPYEEVNKALVKANYSNLSKSARVRVIKSLCKQFDVSDIIALRRVNEVLILNKVYSENKYPNHNSSDQL